MYMHAEFGGAHARGLGDMDFQRKKIMIFWQFLGNFWPFWAIFLRGAIPSL